MRRHHDVLRQSAVLAAVSFMLVAAMVGTGLLGGTAVQDVLDGALDSDASYLAPARPAFSIWSVIYLGLIAYSVWQALPAQRADPRQRQVGWWLALTAVLNGLWLVAAQYTELPVTVVAIVLLLISLCAVFRRLAASRPDGRIEAVLVDGVTGLHLGWVAVATVANVAAWLTHIAPISWGQPADAIGIEVLTVVAGIGCALGRLSGGRIAPALAMAWGLVWIAVARLTGEPASILIGLGALVAAVLVLAAPVLRRVTIALRLDEGVSG